MIALAAYSEYICLECEGKGELVIGCGLCHGSGGCAEFTCQHCAGRGELGVICCDACRGTGYSDEVRT